jgi:cytochrome c556
MKGAKISNDMTTEVVELTSNLKEVARGHADIPETCTMRRRLALIVIVQVVLLGLLGAPGGAEGLTDTREPVQRTEAEKDFVLDQMRLFLTSIVEIEEGLGSGDMDHVARQAAARGRKANVTLARPPALAAKESEAWKTMIASARNGFDKIAEQASAHAPATEINRTLADTMRNCVACHQTYRISVDAH